MMTNEDAIHQEWVDAIRDQAEALDEQRALQDTYAPVQDVVPGRPIIAGSPFTEQALLTIKASQDRVDVAHERARIAQSAYAQSQQTKGQ